MRGTIQPVDSEKARRNPKSWDNRRHHKVSVGLLGRFTADGTDNGTLQVQDLSTSHWRSSTPAREGYERGYYSIDLEGVSPGAVEDYLATAIEGPATPVVKALARSNTVPSKTELGALASFLGMQVLRTDVFRRTVLDHDRQIAGRLIQQLTSDSAFDDFEHRHNVNLPPIARSALRSASLEHSGNSRAVQVMLDTFDQLLGDLRRLRWRVAMLPAEASNLVCSDHPAKFVRVGDDGLIRPIMGGWGRDDVAALMPLSPRHLLFGSTKSVAAVLDWKLETLAVDELNCAIAASARWIYAREQIAAGIVLASPSPKK